MLISKPSFAILHIKIVIKHNSKWVACKQYAVCNLCTWTLILFAQQHKKMKFMQSYILHLHKCKGHPLQTNDQLEFQGQGYLDFVCWNVLLRTWKCTIHNNVPRKGDPFIYQVCWFSGNFCPEKAKIFLLPIPNFAIYKGSSMYQKLDQKADFVLSMFSARPHTDFSVPRIP